MNRSNSRYLNAVLRTLPLIAGLGFGMNVLSAEITFTVQPSSGSPLPPSLPANGSVIFTFQPAVPNPDDIQVGFYYITPTFSQVDVAADLQWSGGNTVLTCTAPGGFPTTGLQKMLFWEISSSDFDVELINADPQGGTDGIFTVTAGGNPSTGSGTNKITSFLLGKIHFYSQTNTSAPVPDPDFMEIGGAYGFSAMTSLASNRTASVITLARPGGGTENLSSFPNAPEDWIFFNYASNSTSLDALYPPGSYTFNVTGNPNQTLPLNFPASLVQPNAPHIANFTALQSADPTQPITISWDPFQGGTAADYIDVEVGTVFRTPDFTEPGALKGNVTSVIIPAGTLQANTTYDLTVGFYKAILTTNSTELHGVYRVTVTDSTLVTGTPGNPGGPISLANPVWSANAFSFDVNCTPGQTVTIETSSTLLPGSWVKYLTTNAPGSTVHISDPRGPGSHLFYRARNGN